MFNKKSCTPSCVYGVYIALTAIVLIFSVIIFIPQNVSADIVNTELITNGGFENGFDSWNVENSAGGASIDTNLKYSGDNSLKFTGSTGNPYVYNPKVVESIIIDTSKSYELSFYVKTSDITTGKFAVHILDFDSSNNPIAWESYNVGGNISYELSPVTGTRDWTKKTIKLRPYDASDETGIHTNTSHIKIYFFMDNNSGTAWVDEVKMTERTVLSELIKNNGFESGMDYWYTGEANGGALIDSDIKHSGTGSVKISGSLTEQRLISNPPPGSERVLIDIAKSYELTMYVKTDNIVTGKFNVFVLDCNSAGNAIAWESYKLGEEVTYDLLPVTGTTEWTQLRLFLHPYNSNDGTGIHPDTDHIKVYLRADHTQGTVWVDDISLKVKETVNVAVDAAVAFNESSENDIAKMKSFISATGVENGVYYYNESTNARLNEIGMRELRTGNLFNNGTVTRDSNGDLVYDFSVAENVIGGIRDLGYDAHVIIGVFTPRCMSICPDDPNYHKYQFADWAEYEDYIYETIKFVNVTKNYNVVHWEVGNEPDTGFWYPTYPSGSSEKYSQYWLKYKHTVNAVNKYEADFPNAPIIKVGGPAITTFTFNNQGWSPFNWLQKMFQDAYNENVRLDFVSYHVYGSANTFGGVKVSDFYPSFETQVALVKSWRDTYKPNAKLYITEWGPDERIGTVYGNVNGGSAGAAYYLNFIYSGMKIDGIDEMIWLCTKDYPEAEIRYLENSTEMYPVAGLRSMWGWASLFNVDNKIKAPYNAAKMISMMGNTRVKAVKDAEDNEVRVLASKDSSKITVMMFNNHWSNDSMKSLAEDRTANVVLNNVAGADGNLKYLLYRIDENVSNAFKYYMDNMPVTNGNSGLQIVASGSVSKVNGTVVLPSVALDKESAVLCVLNLEQDDAAPSVPVISTASQMTDAKKIPVSGTAEAGARIEIINGINPAGICYANSSGIWYEEVDLTDGSNAIKARALDSRGNESLFSSTITVEKSLNTVTAPVFSGSVYEEIAAKTFVISGTAQPGSKVSIYRNIEDVPKYYLGSRSVLAGECTVNTDGTFSEVINLTPGEEYKMTAQAYDTHGNLSSESSIKTVKSTLLKEMLPNGGFESLYAGWAVTPSKGLINIDSVNKSEGNLSLKWTGNGTVESYVNYPEVGNIAIDSTKTYTLSVSIKTQGISSGAIYLRIMDLNSSGTPMGYDLYNDGNTNSDKILLTSGTTDGFINKTINLTPHELDGTGRIPGTASIKVFIFFDGVNTGGYAWVDDIVLSEAD